ncbi:conserved unknown protein [Ectocarpus siliculosus]|uniref:WSC domain-containing protein n=1 Tax=Ectocarpus siliculosus TaxID=2880 RepID=D7FLI9_ECTSI|nr:conserved unknown protein [Ectocarpus siliculosus]|eukprot:CBJ25805.1 conserved unknown protein [Ectocarpus siliculosus]
MIVSSDNSAETCKAACVGYAYYGLQYREECFCGTEDEDYTIYGESNNCVASCTGDASSTCGGNWAMDVYAMDDLQGRLRRLRLLRAAVQGRVLLRYCGRGLHDLRRGRQLRSRLHRRRFVHLRWRLGHGCVRHGRRRDGPACHGAAYHGPACHRSTYHAAAHDGTTYHGSAYHGPSHHFPSYHGPAYHGTSYHCPSYYGTSYHGPAYHGATHHGTSYHGPAYHGTSYHGTSYHCPSHYGTSYHGPSYHGPSYYGTSYHGPAYHCPPYHGPYCGC